jgi:hypothetical protein
MLALYIWNHFTSIYGIGGISEIGTNDRLDPANPFFHAALRCAGGEIGPS